MFWEPQVQDTYSPLTSEFSEFCLRKPQCSTEGGGKLSELLAAQLRPILCDPMDCSPPGSSVHRILQARILEWVAHFLLQGIFPTWGSNLHLLHWLADSLLLGHQGSPEEILENQR